MPDLAPPTVLRIAVASEWVDYNNHLRDSFYLHIFSLSVDGVMDMIGMGDAERRATKTTIYTLEVHLNYMREVKEGEEVEVRAQLLGFDQKRFHLFLWMHTKRLGEAPAATSEFMLLNVDTSEGAKPAPFRADVAHALGQLWEKHRHLAKPQNAGRSIALPKK
jgi:acyl-CoA thioester hydrolase